MQIYEIATNHPEYPANLREIHKPPARLFVVGRISKEPMVAIVGSRQPTKYGEEVTYRLAYDLAKSGFVVVSGLALGVDSIAHQGALDGGGETIAVLGCGPDIDYPKSNRRLKQEIMKRGALISEYPPGTKPEKYRFPARNRIIAGLCSATVVTEANAVSGSLITANCALQENRVVMAVPGNINSPRSAGPNNLLKAGALPVTDLSDILSAFNIPVKSGRESTAKSDEASIIKLIDQGVLTSRELMEHTGMKPSRFAEVISLMEITGKVKNLGAGRWGIGRGST